MTVDQVDPGMVEDVVEKGLEHLLPSSLGILSGFILLTCSTQLSKPISETHYLGHISQHRDACLRRLCIQYNKLPNLLWTLAKPEGYPGILGESASSVCVF